MSVLGRSLPREASGLPNTRVLMPVFTTVFVGMLWWIGLRPFVSQLAVDTGTSVPVIGQILSIGALISAVAGLFTGPLADHYGHRRSILIGLTLLAASATCIALATQPFVFALGMLIGGLGMAMTYGVAFAVVSMRFNGGARSRAMGITQAAASIAIVAGVPALVLIASALLWRGAFLTLAGLLLLALICAYRLLPPDPPARGRCSSPRALLGKYRPLFESPAMRALYTVSTMRAVIVGGLSVYRGAFYVDVFGFSSREVGIAFMLEGLGQVLGNLAGGGRLSGLDQRKSLALGTLLIGTSHLALYTLQPSPFVVVGLAMAFAFVAGISFTSMAALLADESRVGAATTMVLNISTIGFGTALGSALGALLLNAGGYELVGIAGLLTALLAAGVVHASRPATRAPHLEQAMPAEPGHEAGHAGG